MVKKILILYSSLGDGHLSAAKALEQAFCRLPEVEVRREDALDYASPLYRNTIIQLYKQLSEKVPLLYRAYYEGTDTNDLEASLDDNLSVAKLERLFFNKLEELVMEFEPDAIVSVQQIPGRLIQLVEEKNQLKIPHYVVITDVIAHSSWLNYGINGYFIPSQLTANVLIQRGADPSRFQVTGIPVKLEIMEPKTKAEARLKHNLPSEDSPVVTVFGGGLNSKRVRTMVSELMNLLPNGMIIVAAGRNETLLEALEDLEDTEPVQLRKLGLIDYVDDLIVASDLIITKAGGLITSEILARGTPMIIVDPIPGQEEQNADVITIAGAGIQLRLIEMVGPAVEYLLKHPERLAQMREVALEIGQPRAALNIAEYILNNADSQTISELSLIAVETVQNSEVSVQTQSLEIS